MTKTIEQDHRLASSFDATIIDQVRPAIESGQPLELELAIKNVHRTIGAMIAGEIARRHGPRGLPDDSLVLRCRGSAGQSFGAFMIGGMRLELEGDANDYIGKGMSGGVLAVRPPREATFRADQSMLVGNVALYGATGGRAFFSGIAGERFAVRNSGAIAVVEGVGDHGCEYMTGGHVIVIGRTGRNFAAGMSGGIAYIFDEDGRFSTRVNPELVELETLDNADAELVMRLLEEHRARTQSAKAAELISNFSAVVGHFVKVLPSEYRRVLAEAARGRAENDEPTALHSPGAE